MTDDLEIANRNLARARGYARKAALASRPVQFTKMATEDGVRSCDIVHHGKVVGEIRKEHDAYVIGIFAEGMAVQTFPLYTWQHASVQLAAAKRWARNRFNHVAA
jgi:hypothetical protein